MNQRRTVECPNCRTEWGIDAAPGNEREWHLPGCIHWDAWVPKSWGERDIAKARGEA